MTLSVGHLKKNGFLLEGLDEEDSFDREDGLFEDREGEEEESEMEGRFCFIILKFSSPM